MEEEIDKGCHMTRLTPLAMKPEDTGASRPYKESDFTVPTELKENTEEENQLSMNNYQANTNCENTIEPKNQIASTSKCIEGATESCNITKTDGTCSKDVVQGSSNVTENPDLIAVTLFGYMMHHSRPSADRSLSAKRKRILYLIMKKCNISSLDSEITPQFYIELKNMYWFFSSRTICSLKKLIKRYKNEMLKKNLYQHSKSSGSDDMHVSDNSLDQTKIACHEKVNVAVQTRKRGRPRKWTTPGNELMTGVKCSRNRNNELEPPPGQASRLFRAMSNYKFYSTRPDQSAQFKCQTRVDQEKMLYQVMEQFKITGLDVAPPNAFFQELTKMKKFFSPEVLMRVVALVRKKVEKKSVFKLKSYRPIKAKPLPIGFVPAKQKRAERVQETHLYLQQLNKVSEKRREDNYKNFCKETNNALRKDTNGLPILPEVSIRLIPIDQLLKFGKYANSKMNSVNIKEYLEGQHKSLCSSKKSDKHLKASQIDKMSNCDREKREVESNSSSTVQEKTIPDIDISNISDVTKMDTKQYLQLTETDNTLHNITKGAAGGKKKKKQIGDSLTDNTEEIHKNDKSFHIPHGQYTAFHIGKDLCGQSSTEGAEVENKTVSPASACDKPVVEKEVHENQQNKDHTIQVHCTICGNKLEQNSFVSHMTLQHSKWIYDSVFGVSYFGPRDNLFNPTEMIFELPDVNVVTIDSKNVVSAMNVCGIDKVNGWTINKTNMFIRSGKVWFCGKMPIETNWHDIRTFRVECTICQAIIHQTQLYSHLLKFHEHWIHQKIQENVARFDTSGNTISFPLPVICVSMLESGGCVKSVDCTVQELDNVVEIHNIHVNNSQKPVVKKLKTIPRKLSIPVVKDCTSAKKPILIDNDDTGTSSVVERKQHDNALVLPLFSSSKCYLCNNRVKPGTLWLHIKMQHIEWKKMIKSDKPLCSSKYFCTHCLKSSAEFHSLEQLFVHEMNVHGTSYSCFTCGTTCHDQSEYAKHVVKHHAILYMCKQCSLHFSSLQRLQKHTQEYHPGVVLNSESNCKLLCPHCEFCKTNAGAQLEMEHHINTVHIRYTSQTSLTSKYQCYSCTQKFGCQAALEYHQSPDPNDIKTASKECLFFNPNTRFVVYGNIIGRPDNKVSTTINDFSVTVEETGAISVTNSITGTKHHVADTALAEDIRTDLDVLNKLTELLNLYTDKRGTEYKRLVRHKNLVIKMLCRNLHFLQTSQSQTLGQNTPEMNHSSSTSHCNAGLQQLASLPILNSSQSATITAGKNVADVCQSSNVQKEITHTLHMNNATLSVSHASSCIPLVVTYSPTVQDNKAVNVASSPISESLTEKLTESSVSIGQSKTGSHIHAKFPQLDDENSSNRQSCATVVSTNTGYISTAESREVGQTRAQAEQANKGINCGSIIPVIKQTCVPIAGSNTPAFQTANLRSPPVLTESLKCMTQTTASTEFANNANTKVETTATNSTCLSPYGSSDEDVSKVFREMELKAMQRGYFSDKEVKHDRKPFGHIEHSNSEMKRIDNLKSAMKIKEQICELRKSGTNSSSEDYTSHMHSLVDFVRKELEECNAGIIPDLKSVEIKRESESNDSHTEKLGIRSDEYVSLQSQPAFQIPCAATRDVHSSSVYTNMGQTGMDQVAMSNLASLNSQPSQGNTIIINNQQGGSNTIILGNSLTSCLPPTATIFQGQNVAQQLLNQAPMSIVMNGTNLGPCQFPENVLSQTPEEMNNPPFVNTGIQGFHCAGSSFVQTENKQSKVEPVSGKSYTENVGKSLSGVSCVPLPQTANDNTTKPVADVNCNKLVKPKFYNVLPKFCTSQLMLPKYADVEKLNDNRGVELTDHVAVKSHVDVSKSSKVNTSIVESTTIRNKIPMCEDNDIIDRCYIRKWSHRQRGFKKRRRGKGKLWMYNTGNPDSAFKKRSSLKSNESKTAVNGDVERSFGNTSGVKEQGECRRLLRKRKVTNYKEPDSDLSDIDDDAESKTSNSSSPKHSLCTPTCQSETTEDSNDSDIAEFASIEDGGDEISLVIQDVRSEAFAEYESGLGNEDKNIGVEFNDSMDNCDSMHAIETSKDMVSPNLVQNTHSNLLSLEDNHCVQSNINSNKILDSNQIKTDLCESILNTGAITIKSEPIDSYDSDTQKKVFCDEQENCEIQHADEVGHSLHSEQQTLSATAEQNNYKGAEKNRVKGIRGRPRKKFVPAILSKSSGQMSADKMVLCDEQQSSEVQPTTELGHSANSEQQTLSKRAEKNNYKGAKKVRKGGRGRPRMKRIHAILSKSSGQMSAEKMASPPISGKSHQLRKSHITSVTGAPCSIAPAGNSFINSEPLNTNKHLVGSTPVQGLSAMAQPVLMSQPIAVQQPLVQFRGSTLFNSGNQAQPLFVQNPAGTFIQQGQSQLQALTATQQNQTLFVQPTQLPVQQQPNVKQGNQLTQPIFIPQNQLQQTATAQQSRSNHSLPTQNQIQAPNFQSLNPVQQSMFAQVQQGCAIQPTLQNQPIIITPNQIQQTNIIQPNQNNNPLLIVQNSAQQGTPTQSQRLLAPKPLLQPKKSTQEQLKLQAEQQKPLKTETSLTIKQEPISINSSLGQPVQSLPAKLPLLPQKDEMLTTLNKSTTRNVNTEKIQSCQNIGNMIPASSTNTFNPLQQAMSPITAVGQPTALTPGSIVIQQGVGPQPSFLQPSVIGQQPQYIQNLSCGQYVQQPVSVAMSAPQMFNIPVVNAGTQQLVVTSKANQLQTANAMSNIAVPSATLEKQNANGKLPLPRNIVNEWQMNQLQLLKTRNWSKKTIEKSFTYR